MKKRGLTIILSMMFVISIGLSSAYSVSPTIPTSISLNCEEPYHQKFIINTTGEESISLSSTVISGEDIQIIITVTSENEFYLSLFQVLGYTTSVEEFSFKINEETETYTIKVNVTAGLRELDSITLSEGISMDIGGKIDFSILTVGENKIRYIVECENIEEGFLNIGESYDIDCNGESFRFELENSFADLDAAIMKVYSSESGYAITKSDRDLNNAECILGIDTLGAKVKRGNIFAIKTININNNKYIAGVSVTVLDQTGDLAPINDISSNIGFFSERLYEEYEQGLVVQLEKEGCEPYTNVILFDRSYSDFIEDKEQQELEKTLQLEMDSLFIVGQEVSGTVTNLINEAVEKAKVKITKPDDTTFEILTSESGLLKFTPESVGLWKIQITKENFESSALYEIQAISGEYDIIALVDGDPKSRFEKGDRIVFELRGLNDTIIPLDVKATYGNDDIEFVQGVSEEIKFVKDYKLIIPESEGYKETDYKTKKVDGDNIIYWILGIVVALILLVVISKFKNNSTSSKKLNKMEVQLGNG